jgi:hypothetical protein
LNNKIPLLGLVLAASLSFAQAALPSHDTGSSSAPASWSASAVWRPDADFIKTAHAACDDAKQPPNTTECFITQMEKAGAPADAVKFTRALYKASGQLGMMGEFKSFPPVGMAWVIYPLRANNNDGILIVNGKPPFVDPDDMQKLDRTALQKDPLFLEWKQTAPKLDVWPGDRSGGAAQVHYARVWTGDKPGEQTFLFSYPLVDGCSACARSGFVNYWWIFDASGKFVGTQMISVTRGVPPLRRRGVRPTAPAAPGAPTATAPGTEDNPAPSAPH